MLVHRVLHRQRMQSGFLADRREVLHGGCAQVEPHRRGRVREVVGHVGDREPLGLHNPVAVQAGTRHDRHPRTHTRPRLPALAPVAPILERAIAAVVTAAVAVSGVVPYTSCQNTFLAPGSRFNRSADLYTDPGAEDTLIQRIADALPASEHPRRSSPVGGGAAPPSADLGGDVHLRVSQLGREWLETVAETGCRTATHTEPVDTTPPADAVTAVTRLLAALGTTPTTWQVQTVTCPTGAITSGANRLAWRDGATSVIVAASDDGTHITAQRTTIC